MPDQVGHDVRVIVMPGSDRIVMPGLTGHLSGIVNPSSRALTRDLQ
jgi:hypothetical protein